MEKKYKKPTHAWDLFIAFTIGFAVASFLFIGMVMAMGTVAHLAQNHNH